MVHQLDANSRVKIIFKVNFYFFTFNKIDRGYNLSADRSSKIIFYLLDDFWQLSWKEFKEL